MNRMRYWIGFLGFCFMLGFAQSTDPILQSYSLAMENLTQASRVFSSDAQQSIEALNDASQMLRPLSERASSTIIPGLERTFERAKTALQNQSSSDLEVQISVLKGGFWRILYESAIQAGEAGDLASSKLRLSQMAKDMGLSEGVSSSITNAEQILAALANLETGIAQNMLSGLNEVQTLLETNEDIRAVQAAMYERLALSYSLYLPVQDSPRSSTALNTNFNRSFSNLINADKENFRADLAELQTQTAGFLAASQALVNVSAPATISTSSSAVEAEAASETAVAAVSEAAETISEVIPESESTPIPALVTATSGSTISTSSSITSSSTEALQRQLLRLGLSNDQQNRLIERYNQEGFSSLNDALDRLYADSAKIIVALNQGEQSRAKSLIKSLQNTYGSYLKPILDQSNPNFAQSFEQLFSRLQSAPGLRLQDSIVLNTQIDALASVLSNNPVAGLNKTEAAATTIWAGWLRLILTIVLGFCTFLPLYFLYLAFGGGNRNWQLIGWALFFLFLPLMFEGLSYLASLISELAGGITFLDSISRFSIFQSTLSQILWVIVSGAGISLAALGLYGICVQFGLLGQASRNKNQTIVDTSNDTKTNTTSFDWDEEF